VGEPAGSDLAPGRRGPVAVFSWDGERLDLVQRVAF